LCDHQICFRTKLTRYGAAQLAGAARPRDGAGQLPQEEAREYSLLQDVIWEAGETELTNFHLEKARP
jgi:hypothetical protein